MNEEQIHSHSEYLLKNKKFNNNDSNVIVV